jgi:hypothetical protein
LPAKSSRRNVAINTALIAAESTDGWEENCNCEDCNKSLGPNEETNPIQEWEDRVIEAQNATDRKSIDPGVCASCADCQSAYGMTEAEMTEAQENDRLNDEGGFSWSSLRLLRKHLGGDRYAAHGFIDDKIVHYDVCVDCLMYLANGTLPNRVD